ncbi:hypothetical protein TCAL_15106 [Tigriopus californicus]|uniref:Platelet-derived growth factor (PDGF) family profile domain-containing protein n=1 Tax=Tigriopus californicus TaxID=6832 RepID=A0A553NTE2_TIGCA|nr:uncharacterized protein LOC131885008 [Tigriopus californicus]TRY68701.1 hypothetical protein TCAL_15106 [Tigriopus californicus]
MGFPRPPCSPAAGILILVLAVASQAVKTPSASASTSLSMASSLLSLTSDADSLYQDSLQIVNDQEECKVKNLKHQEKMFMAKLDAHRCLVRDTVVAVPVPQELIVNYVQPSHVVVPRCTGLCLERPGCECQPKRKKYTKVDIIVGTNSSATFQLCSTVQIEEHRGPCRCKCTLTNCHYNKVFDEDQCLCRCKSEFANLKSSCMKDFEREWDEESCTCRCRARMCVSGHYQDRATCQCKPLETSCSAIATAIDAGASVHHQNTGHLAVSQAPKYVGLSCVALIALFMLLTMYYLMVKKGGRHHHQSRQSRIRGRGNSFMRRAPSLVGSSAHPDLLVANGSTETVVGTLQRAAASSGMATAAYTITINSQSANNLDEAMLPLTEDKTRF